MSRVQFVDELPPSEGGGGFRDFWKALDANPGRWAIWPGTLDSARAAARNKNLHNKNGTIYEAHQRGGVAYVRRIS